ncbi:MAG: hypothetical protein ACLUGW_07925 [Oscillospiraceae bacterium]
MENTKKKGLPVFIGVASVWMGTHFGPGVASGTQLNQYYVNFGIPGIIMTLVAMALLGFALYCSMEFSRIYKAYDYESWVTKLFNNKYVVILFDVSFFVTIISAAGGSLNAIATLLQDFWGINYWVGVGIVIVVSMLLCAFGAELVRKSSAYMMFVVVGVLLLIMALVIAAGDADLKGAVENQAANLGADMSASNWLKALWQAIIYGSFQATIVANIASVADTLPDRRESRRAAITGYIANTGLLLVLCMMLFSFTNVYAVTNEALPFYSILARLNMGWLTVVYIIVVFIAVISTVVGFAFAGVARFGKYYRPAGRKHLAHPLRDALFVLVLLAACAAISQVGIMNLVKYGYSLLGYINLFVIILPALIIGGRKISKKYLKEHNIDAPGID